MGKASRKKQDLYRGVDGEGRPLFPADEPTRSSLAGVPLSWLLAVVAGGLWVGAHVLGAGGSVVTAVYIVAGAALGIANPALAAALTVAVVPFEGGAGGTLHRVEGVEGLALNEIGRIRLRSTKPLFVDPYLSNRQTGAFILVDESTNRTVAAGMIVGESAG